MKQKTKEKSKKSIFHLEDLSELYQLTKSTMEKYKWARNPLKLQRAIASVQSKVGAKYKESDVKKLYVEYGGLLSETNDTTDNIEDDSPTQEE